MLSRPAVTRCESGVRQGRRSRTHSAPILRLAPDVLPILHNDAVFFLTVAKMRNCEWDKMPYDSQRRADPRMSLMTHVTSTSSGSGGRHVRRNLADDQTDRKSIIATY